MEHDDNKFEELINTGSQITGSVSGGILGFLLGGPAGTAVGAASGILLTKALQKVGIEMKNRFLSPREEVRIGATVSYAAMKIKSKIDAGEKVRDDIFFDISINDRSDADEVFEAVLISAQKEYEEKKIKLYSNLLCNLAFNEEIDKLLANQLVKLANDLSYRQLCAINVIMQSNPLKIITLRNRNYRDSDPSKRIIPVLYDLVDLSNRNLIVNPIHHVFGLTDVNPAEFVCGGLGVLLYQMMELNTIDYADIKELIELLKQ